MERDDCSVCDDAQHNSGSFHGRSLLVDLSSLDVNLAIVLAVVLLVRAQGQDHPKVQKVGDFDMKY